MFVFLTKAFCGTKFKFCCQCSIVMMTVVPLTLEARGSRLYACATYYNAMCTAVPEAQHWPHGLV